MDDVAIEKTKSAFLLKIGERWADWDYKISILAILSFERIIWWYYYGSLQNNWGMTCTATEDDVDVFVSGYAFRLKIWHERGLTLLRRESKN